MRKPAALPFYNKPSLNPHESIGYLLRRASRLSTTLAEAAFQETEISFIQWVVLALINSGLATTCAELSRHLDHNSGAMTRLVDHLQGRALLTRHPDSRDRRVSRLQLTARGVLTVTELANQVGSLWNDLLEGIEPADVGQMITLLNRLVERAEGAVANRAVTP